MGKTRFKSFDNRFIVEFSDKTFNDIKLECIKTKNKETGGILIGNYSYDNSCAIINSIIGPPDDSKQYRYSFKRGVSGLIELLESKWKNHGHYYLGEWHFHPSASPYPSRTDNIQMEKLSKDTLLKCPEPILLVIGGNQEKGWELSVHVYIDGRRVALTKG